jgi:hypothetical protein
VKKDTYFRQVEEGQEFYYGNIKLKKRSSKEVYGQVGHGEILKCEKDRTKEGKNFGFANTDLVKVREDINGKTTEG